MTLAFPANHWAEVAEQTFVRHAVNVRFEPRVT
ncbi:hypothetical protein DSM107133_01549 [Pseudosulfitobacter sp. DSM 107133]|nr:hypothetical protein DSM107133_01549 [Pseudosulfitobacter sp. DSM 107133]